MADAFEGLHVLDLSERLAGAYAARMFADFGADVILAEPSEGHPLRHEPPFLDGEAGPERSLVHAYINRNKRSLVIDDATDLAAQIAAADLIVTTAAPIPASLASVLEAKRDDAVQLSLTPFGLTGPLAGVAGNNLIYSAMSGWADLCAIEDEAPLSLPPQMGEYIGGVAGFLGAAAALVRRAGEAGGGGLVDASEFEAVMVSSAPWALALNYDGPGGYTEGVHVQHRARSPFQRAADGQIVVVLGQGPFWADAMQVLGLGQYADEQYDDTRRRRDLLIEIESEVSEAIAKFPRWELFNQLSTIRNVAGVVQDSADLLANEQMRSRGYFVESEIEGRPIELPGAPALLQGSPWRVRRSAPRLNQHAEEAKPASAPVTTSPSGSASADGTRAETPLAGVRVLTFTQAWSGPLGTELLALLGADVVQIEARRRPDVWRTYAGGYEAEVPPGVRDPSRRQRAWNTMGLYNGTNLNKRAITLDMGDPRGADIFWRMLPGFDVVAENFSSHALPNWGITYETLREARPDIIFASLSGYGASGPYATYAANGGTIEPMSGLSSLHGYAGDRAQATGGLIPDPVGGYYLATSIIAALHHRALTGDGQRIDLSMTEAMVTHLGEAIAEQSANGRTRGPLGNWHARFAPYGMFEARDGEWLALAVENDRAWRALATEMGMPALAEDPRFATATARKEHEGELDPLVSRWCIEQEAETAATALLAIGCAAARVEKLEQVLRSPHAQGVARDFLVPQEHPEAGTTIVPAAPWRFDGQPVPLVRPSPCMGEHSFEVFREELGMSEAEYQELVDSGVTGDMPPA